MTPGFDIFKEKVGDPDFVKCYRVEFALVALFCALEAGRGGVGGSGRFRQPEIRFAEHPTLEVLDQFLGLRACFPGDRFGTRLVEELPGCSAQPRRRLGPPGFADGVAFLLQQEKKGFEKGDCWLELLREGVHAFFGQLIECGQVGHVPTVGDEEIAQIGGVFQAAVVLANFGASLNEFVAAEKPGGALLGWIDLQFSGVEEIGGGRVL